MASWIPHTGVAEAFKVKQLYPWQAGALECGEDGSNLVYCAPTSGVFAEHTVTDMTCHP